ncbi:MAG: AEC family transporter [Oscillospiraceae bacterium]|nr:AEC family transporter [Oscillospiraceae bacterium]
MEELMIMLRNVLMFVALAIPGFVLVKTKLLKPEQSGVLSKLLMYLALPFMIFSGVVKNLTFDGDSLLMLGVVALIGMVVVLGMFFVSAPLVNMEKNQKTKGMMRFCAVFANNGFLGIPLAVAVFGGDSPVFTVLIVLNIINNVLMYTLGAYLATGDKKNISVKKAFLNPVLVAFVLGCICNLLGVGKAVPEVGKFSDHFGSIVTPISMTIIGMKLGAISFRTLFSSGKLYYVSFLKLVLFPVVITAAMIALKPIFGNLPATELILGMFVAFSMPTAGLSATFADEFGGDTQNAVIFTLGTTVLSVITIPTLYYLVNLFI